MARVPGTRNMLLWGWNGDAPGAATLAEVLEAAGVADNLAWMVHPDAFAPVSPDEGRRLIDGDSPVEALANAAWREAGA